MSNDCSMYSRTSSESPSNTTGNPYTTKECPTTESIRKPSCTTCNQDNSGSRLPDAERSERISWPRPVVEHHPFCEICEYAQCTRPWVWRKNDKNKDRVKIYLPNQQYLVVLGERRDYWVLITAYYVNRQWSIDKLEKEYNSRFSTKIQ